MPIIFFVSSCGVKGAPMPRRDEIFIGPSKIKRIQEKRELELRAKEKLEDEKEQEQKRAGEKR